MSGGFFRGTSADQDTRFSNKQAKLLKSQKFAPELEHLVDMTKVNMEVIKPWITKRVTELLGFEDEVLINFIHSLLDAKEANGKEVQIQITGFMEKNTGKFMKELWALLLSAQKNASGVPQQLLDAKEEELRKKKVENDRITSEIQTKKDKEVREIMQERLKKMDGAFDAKDTDIASDLPSKLGDSDNRKETSTRNGVQSNSRVSRSPRSSAAPKSPRRISPSRSRSSQSYSGRRSRTISRSPQARKHSLSSERMRHSPRQSISPRRRNSPRQSPSPRRKSSYSRRRFRSPPYRSPSPVRRRVHSPYHNRSPPLRRRGSPLVRRYRSPSPLHRTRSPSPIQQRRSPPPRRRRSLHEWRRSLSPIRRRSPSPVRQRYRSRTPQRRSRSPIRRRSPVSKHKRSPSPFLQRSPRDEWSSPSPIWRESTSPVRRISSRYQRSPVHSSRERVRTQERLSPVAHRTSSPSRHKQREKDRNLHPKSEDSLSTPQKSLSESPQARNRHSSEDERPVSPYQTPQRQRGEKLTRERSLSPLQNQRLLKHRCYSSETSEGEETYSREDMDKKSKSFQRKSTYSSPVSKRKNFPGKVHSEDKFSPQREAGHLASESLGHSNDINLSKEGRELKSDKSYGRGSYVGDSRRSDDKNNSHINNVKDSDKRRKSEAADDSVGRVDNVNRSASYDSSSEENDKHRKEGKGRGKHKRSERKAVSSDEDDSYDSELEERKEAKRRKKEERKLRKEEKRRRREERRRRREERHAEKLKMKNKTDDYASDDEEAHRMDSHRSGKEETVSEQKKLEIELRNKALESFKAKKGLNH